MRSIAEQIKTNALALPPGEREEIARALVDSLGGRLGLDPEAYAEVLRRLNEARSGMAEMVDGEEVMAELEALIGAEVPLPSQGSR